MLDPLEKLLGRYNKLEKYTKYALVLIAVGLAIRLSLSIYTSVSGDACWHLSAAKYIGSTGQIPLFEPLGRDIFWPPPLFHLMNAFSYLSLNWLLGEASLKLVAPVLGALFLWFAFLVVRKLFSSKIAFYSTLFLFMLPLQLYQSAIGYPDIAFGLFSLMAIYYALENRLIISSVATGLALLTKTNAFFIFPVIIYMICKNSPKKFWKKFAIFAAIAIMIALPWYVRDYVYLGNPVWPFMNNVFHGYSSPSVPQQTIGFDVPRLVETFYLSMFGVPNGNMQNLSLLDGWMLTSWLALTLIFISFFFIGLARFLKNRKRSIGYDVVNILFVSLFLLQVIMAMNIGDFQTRYIMPALIFFSIYWAIGMMHVSRNKLAQIIVVIILLVSGIGFIAGEFAKSYVAGNMWSVYDKDFIWVKNNIEKDALVMTPNSQCYAYKLDKYTASTMFVENGFYSIGDIDYIFYPTTNSFVINTYEKKPALLDRAALVYENNMTGISVYKVMK
ncbi:MAG: glycosyltransferase family 39 protein [Candidatus Aenigmarchaeota archaeon]|nr:glycosyltransferase family 39 protein [Candidatus Aenigmarchaeota archaeon]